MSSQLVVIVDDSVTNRKILERLAGALGDPIGANILMLGYAWQLGLVPVSFAAPSPLIDPSPPSSPLPPPPQAATRKHTPTHSPTPSERMAKPSKVKITPSLRSAQWSRNSFSHSIALRRLFAREHFDLRKHFADESIADVFRALIVVA